MFYLHQVPSPVDECALGHQNFTIIIPVVLRVHTPPLSLSPSTKLFWLYFITSTSYKLALNLVDSMKVEVISSDSRLQDLLGITPISYEDAIDLAFAKITSASGCPYNANRCAKLV